ncbi:hypothetical protein GWK47_005801 [Chionoecetes opilio]|uniref:Uncharacterized protein n=1 Tax=Chionoecetes opilio TaxID=41210 RepID=A0A8J4Y7J0_CHIOP|nr:hypothetical protein GWK47_005801 [Chionoecetes opilio]
MDPWSGGQQLVRKQLKYKCLDEAHGWRCYRGRGAPPVLLACVQGGGRTPQGGSTWTSGDKVTITRSHQPPPQTHIIDGAPPPRPGPHGPSMRSRRGWVLRGGPALFCPIIAGSPDSVVGQPTCRAPGGCPFCMSPPPKLAEGRVVAPKFSLVIDTLRQLCSTTQSERSTAPTRCLDSENITKCHSITGLSGVGFNSPPIGRQLYTLWFHLLDVRDSGRENVPHPGHAAPKVRWCWLARERGTSTASPLVSTVLVLRVATLGGCRSPARCGTPSHLCLVEYHKRRDIPAVVPVSREDSPARTGWGVWGVCSIHRRRARRGNAVQPPSVRGCARHPERAAYSKKGLYLGLIEQELPSPVEESGYPSRAETL